MFGIIHRLMREKSALSAKRCDLAGSPPPMRGKGSVPCFPALLYGITPAYAGKSDGGCCANDHSKDHPRLCGEKIAAYGHGVFVKGSPPPMRGKAIIRVLCQLILRITPAYAGKSLGFDIPPGSDRDHPRLCGEKAFAILP